MRSLVAATIILGLVGCAAEMQKVTDTLSSTNQSMKGSRGKSAPTAVAMPQPSQAQITALRTQLNSQVSNKDLLAARAEAEPTIEKFIGTLACHAGKGGASLGTYLAPDMHTKPLRPMNGMRYHDRSQCLTVARMDDWSMKARNALAFRVVYVSDQSGESKDRRYEMVKQPDGAWLFRRAGL